jgi:hypothetical protein
VPRAPWTYEVPPGGSDAAGLEDYQVESASGQPVGKVKVVLRRNERLYLAVEAGAPPVAGRVRAVDWKDVAQVDHAALTVRLGIEREALGAAAELDAAKAVEGEGAEATRVTDVPGDVVRSSSPAEHGPADRPTYLAALVAGLLGVFGALALVLVATATETPWVWSFAVLPGALLVAAGLLIYRFFRYPTEP